MDWTDLRRECPVTTRWAYFDHAAVAPLTERARQTLVTWAADLAENGDVYDATRVRQIEEIRRHAGQLLNADPLDMAFIKNTSEGIGIVAEGLPWQAGDNVVTAEDEYPANLYPWMNLAHRGVELRRVPSRDGRIILDDLRASIDNRTRLVSLSFVEYASGFRNDLDAVGGLCREKSVLFFVDAIQGLGVLPLDVRRTPIDFLAADGHKWLLGPEGAGLLWIRRELVEQLHPVGVGWNSVIDSRNFDRVELRLKPHAGRWESGSLNVGGILALGASLELLLGVGINAIAERVLHLTDYLCEQAERIGVSVYSSRRPNEKSGIVSLIVPGGETRAMVRRCRDAGIVINQRAGRLRISPHAYNTTEELDRLIALLGASS
ncbi:MAG TPA: aminotransferase class V-fold PLP-dependent enzyme [Gemmataceae bacterium]|nr:aminotransferase class V-fold PLP-dependent enzyme [Gemmataceae bacterium]